MTHQELVSIAARYLSGTRRCRVVLVEKGLGTEICDAIGWSPGAYGIVIECKVSRADFRQDRKKPHRDQSWALGCERWYLAPKGLLSAEEIPDGWGLLEVNRQRVRPVKPARINGRDPLRLIRELMVALKEIRKYQAQGIQYRKVLPDGGYGDGGRLGSLASLCAWAPLE